MQQGEINNTYVRRRQFWVNVMFVSFNLFNPTQQAALSTNLAVDSKTLNNSVEKKLIYFKATNSYRGKMPKTRRKGTAERTKRESRKLKSKTPKLNAKSVAAGPSSQPSVLYQAQLDKEIATEMPTTSLHVVSNAPSEFPSVNIYHVSSSSPSLAPTKVVVSGSSLSHSPSSLNAAKPDQTLDADIPSLDNFLLSRLPSKLPTPVPSIHSSHGPNIAPVDPISDSILSTSPSISAMPDPSSSHRPTASPERYATTEPSSKPIESREPTVARVSGQLLDMPQVSSVLSETVSSYPIQYAYSSPTVSMAPVSTQSSIRTHIPSSAPTISGRIASLAQFSFVEKSSSMPTVPHSLVPVASGTEQLLRQFSYPLPHPLSEMDSISTVVDEAVSNMGSSCRDVVDDISVKSFVIEFEYLLFFAPDLDVNEILSDIEISLHEYVVMKDLDCGAILPGKVRRMQRTDNTASSPPVGFETTPVDIIKPGDACNRPIAATILGTSKCEVVKGGFTVHFQNATKIDQNELNERYLRISQDFMEKQWVKNVHYDLIDLSFREGTLKEHHSSSGRNTDRAVKHSTDIDLLVKNDEHPKNARAPRFVVTIIVLSSSLTMFFAFVFLVARRRKMQERKRRTQADHDFDLDNSSDIFSSEDGLSSVGIDFTVHPEETSANLGRERRREPIPPYPSFYYGKSTNISNKAQFHTSNIETPQFSIINTIVLNDVYHNELTSTSCDGLSHRVQSGTNSHIAGGARFPINCNFQSNDLISIDNIWDDEVCLPSLT